MRLNPERLSRARLLVLGDVMLDRYWSGSTSRLSPEAPVPVVRVTGTEDRPGGAANVAVNAAALGAEVVLLGRVGDDEAGRTLAALLRARQVTPDLEVTPGVATCTKFRILSQHQQLLRVDWEDDPGQVGPAGLLAALDRRVGTADVLVLSDYAKGALANPQPYIQAARRQGLPVLIDPKGEDFHRYRGATVLTPNRADFEAVVGTCACEADLLARGETLRRDLGLSVLLITRGEQGMTLIDDTGTPHHLPTRSREVFDVTGAGDTVIATLAVGLGAGYSLLDAAHLANAAAGIVVAQLGATAPRFDELALELQGREPLPGGVVDANQAQALIRQARALGERVVMTHGRFDPLHAGHIDFLGRARAEGERLIVAVEGDGPAQQTATMALAGACPVLAALRAVDWVIPLGQASLEELCSRLQPDVLVLNDKAVTEHAACIDRIRSSGATVKALSIAGDAPALAGQRQSDSLQPI